MAGRAVLTISTLAEEQSDGAAPHAFPIYEFVTMLVASTFAVAELLSHAWFAEHVLLLEAVLRRHSLSAVLHTSEIGSLALVALINGAVVHGEFFEFVKVDIAFCDDSASFVKSLVDSHFDAEFHDNLLGLIVLEELGREDRHAVVDHHLLLAAGAVEISESDLYCRILMT